MNNCPNFKCRPPHCGDNEYWALSEWYWFLVSYLSFFSFFVSFFLPFFLFLCFFLFLLNIGKGPKLYFSVWQRGIIDLADFVYSILAVIK